MAKNNRKSKVIVSGMVLFICFNFALFLSYKTSNTDFPRYYYAANIILDSNIPNISIYDIKTINKYSIPEAAEIVNFPYSMAVAYIMSPLALLPYFKAKTVMIFINIMMYIAAIAIALRLGRASGRWFFYPLALSCLWPPFIDNMLQGQINAVLLFLIAAAVFAATKNQYTICGIFFAIATLFKFFPIGIAMVLGIKNWRIFASCLVAFALSFLIPGSLKWFSSISNTLTRYEFLYNPIYLWLKDFDPVWFWIYAFSIASFTALIVYRSKDTNYPILTSIAIHAVILTIPIIEYHHLTVLTFSYAYIIALPKLSKRLLLRSIIISIIMISIPFFDIQSLLKLVTCKIIYLLGVFMLWAALAYDLFNVPLFLKRTG